MYLASLQFYYVKPTPGELYLIDPGALKAYKLKLPSAIASKKGLNSVRAVNPVMGFITTIDSASTAPASAGDLYRYVITSSGVNMTKLNTSPFTGGNLAQVAIYGNKLYLTSQNPSGNDGILWSVPMSGGAPKIEVDFSKVQGYGGLANACIEFNNKIYVASWPWKKNNVYMQQLWEYDPATKKVAKVMDLPRSKYTTYLYVVNMTVDTKQKLLVLVGLYRDVVYIDPVNKKVVKHFLAGTYSKRYNKMFYNLSLLNSCAYNPDTGDVALGTRTGHFDLATGSHGTFNLVPGVGSNRIANRNSVSGLTYLPAAGTLMDYTYGDGWRGSQDSTYYKNQYYFMNVNLGLPFAGQKWGAHAHNGLGGTFAFLILGTSNTSWGGIPLPFDLTPLGAPGNYVRCSHDLVFTTTLSGTGPGKGYAGLSWTVPTVAKGLSLYYQWYMIDAKANTLGLVVSNARKATFF